MLETHEADRIESQIKEPFIQKYLKSLAVHVCTVPVTQIVSILVAFFYVRMHPELSFQEATLHAGIILGLFQVTPISPGSLVRGLYVSFLVLRERNFKDYSIAFYLSFFKYIGYLAFPIQMAYRYPDLARFMAVHWATGAVHIVPVFGEKGALLEHAVFDLFYNYPLTVRHRIRQRAQTRSLEKTRAWHFFPCVILGTALLGLTDTVYFWATKTFPLFNDVWWLAVWFPALASILIVGWAGGAPFSRRLALGTLGGTLTGIFYAGSNRFLFLFLTSGKDTILSAESLRRIGVSSLWFAFLFTLVALAAALFAETRPVRPRQNAVRP